MKVKALCRINYSGEWHVSGDVFEISTTDMNDLDGLVEVAETPIREETTDEDAPKKTTGRRKKTDTE